MHKPSDDTSIVKTVSQNHSKDPTDPETSKAELKAAVQESQEVLIKASSFGMFPDTITLDRAQLTITKRMFMRVAEVNSMRVEDILNVVVSVGPVFGNIKFFSRTADIHPCEIDHLWRSDALRIKRITQGYVVAIQREIDCSHLSTTELIRALEQLDQTDSHS